MIERVISYFNLLKGRWGQLSRKSKVGIYTASGTVLALLILIILLSSYKHFVPLYSNLSTDEAGQIKQTLDSKGIPYRLSTGGTTISVPQKQVDALKLDLAAQGIPKSGQIDYSIFGKNTNFGMTDNQFNVLQRAAIQTELSNLVSGIDGVQSAKVMINLPQQSVWVSDKPQEASASIVLHLKPGYQLKADQVSGLYHLVSKSIPNLPTSNIVIMDQNFNYYNENSLNNSSGSSTLSVFQQQEQVKAQIEKDIRQRVQQMLGMMMGTDKVMVNVSTSIDFTKTNSKQQLVQPVDPQTMQGLVVSSEHIQNTYNGSNSNQSVGTGSSQVPGYPSTATGTSGNTSNVDNKVNYVFNQINNDIQSSPYKLKDLGIQVMVEPPNPNNPKSLSAQSKNDIKSILNTIIQTSLNQSGQSLTPQQIASKSIITVEKFNGKLQTLPTVKKAVPKWVWYAAGAVLLVVLLLLISLIRRRGKEDDLPDEVSFSKQAQDAREAGMKIPPFETTGSPESVKKKQLENMAKDSPQDFVKLLRSWISEE